MSEFTGTDLRALRKGLVLTHDSFAKTLGLKPQYLRKAERLKDKPIPIEGEFKLLYDKILYAAPRMIKIRFDHMNKIQNILQLIAMKLQTVDKKRMFVERMKQKKDVEEASTTTEEEEDYEKEDDADNGLILRSGGVDRRSSSVTTHEDDD